MLVCLQKKKKKLIGIFVAKHLKIDDNFFLKKKNIFLFYSKIIKIYFFFLLYFNINFIQFFLYFNLKYFFFFFLQEKKHV